MNKNQELIEKSIKFKELLKKSKNILYQNKTDKIFITIETTESKSLFYAKNTLNIVYGVNETPFGNVLLDKTDKGISNLLFITESEENFIQKFLNKSPKANFVRNDLETESLIKKIFYSKEVNTAFNLHLIGTDFQVKVWQALLNIPEGAVVSYSDVSEYIKHPNANRAVGTAIGQNPMHYLIPCHRVIKSDGKIGGYAAGTALKQSILMQEIF
ncbi:MAG TPA: 6-O-methylguanine DNA methyltransferase [Cyanobacteria bacterium UBA9971]|nr:6-O-methylguanine DNA methyltransferase [Cyanobacteria bacterium UBA9971]